MRVTVRKKGSLLNMANEMLELSDDPAIKELAEEGLVELKNATPTDTGSTADSWSYKIEKNQNGFSIAYYNDNMVDGVPVVILLQYGHATKYGYFVEGRDFINPVLDKVFGDFTLLLDKEANI